MDCIQPTRLLRPWDFPGKSTGVGCHCPLRGGLSVWWYSWISFIAIQDTKQNQQRKNAMRHSPKGSRHKFPGALLLESERSHLVPPGWTCGSTGERLSTREARERLSGAPRGFIDGWSRRPPLSNMYQNSRLPEEKQILSINHTVCANGLSIQSCPYLLRSVETESPRPWRPARASLCSSF